MWNTISDPSHYCQGIMLLSHYDQRQIWGCLPRPYLTGSGTEGPSPLDKAPPLSTLKPRHRELLLPPLGDMEMWFGGTRLLPQPRQLHQVLRCRNVTTATLLLGTGPTLVTMFRFAWVYTYSPGITINSTPSYSQKASQCG